MKKAASISKLIAGLIACINGLFALFANTIAQLSFLPGWVSTMCLAIYIVLGLFLVLGSLWDFIAEYKKNVRQHKFEYQSKEFFQFFSDWYQQSGMLSIICGDLDWIMDENDTSVYERLVAKSENGELTLLLGNGFGSKIATELEGKGAKVARAPGNIVSFYTFSCLSQMDDVAGKIIVRDKRGTLLSNTNKIIFEEVRNIYAIDLLNALLEEKGSVYEKKP